GAVFPSDRHYRETAIAAIAQVYSQRDARPLWEESPLPPVSQRALGEALKRHAMPELMALDPETLVAAIPEGPVEARDLANTVAFCDAALLVRLGVVPATKIWPDWDSQDKPGSDNRTVESIVPDLLTATALRPFEMEKAIDLMGPQNWIYRELLKAYPAAREAILQYSGLPQIPDPEQIGAGKPGELYPAAPAIAAHLIDKGYLRMAPELAPTITSMTPELTTALIAFQNDFGLDADGIFGQTSWRYLNTNAANHFRSIVLNLHRARLMPGKLGDRYLIANLPCAELHLFDANDFHSQSMRVVHGRADKESHHTKIFRDRMQEVVFGPYWNVPPSIATKELLPKIQEDWGYLGRNDYELVTSFGASAGGRMSPDMLQAVAQGKVLIRQKPGNNNALGYVKFLFPNSFNIYMHDTPSKSFFARANRDFSHGCIRVAKPDELAAWIFAPEGWTLERVRNSMKNDLNKGVAVKGGINVYITYFTLFPRPVRDGRILLAPGRDVYGLDAVNAKTLAAVLPWKE
ncbi:MAG TPA: L,D-transpeptidase family protein, partial [Bacteroidia bacterium]|nr:L,D-transpeptidase family protein [Bacteroidia bacterium]